jgi:hypothetical protein
VTVALICVCIVVRVLFTVEAALATSMLTELVIGKTADEAAALEKDDLLAEVPIPLTPVRLKCALLGLTTLKMALHRSRGTPLPVGLTTADAGDFS